MFLLCCSFPGLVSGLVSGPRFHHFRASFPPFPGLFPGLGSATKPTVARLRRFQACFHRLVSGPRFHHFRASFPPFPGLVSTISGLVSAVSGPRFRHQTHRGLFPPFPGLFPPARFRACFHHFRALFPPFPGLGSATKPTVARFHHFQASCSAVSGAKKKKKKIVFSTIEFPRTRTETETQLGSTAIGK
jgi:hypothetical protein